MPIQSRNRLDILIRKIKLRNLQILLQSLGIVTLGNNGQPSLRRPPQQNLRRRLPHLLSDLRHDGVLEQYRCILRLLPLQLNERLWSERTVRRDSDTLLLSQLEESRLDEVRVVFDLQGCGADLCVAEEIEDEGALEVGDSNGLCETLLGDGFHGCPGLLDAGVGELVIFLAVEGPAGWVADGRVDVFQSDGEVHDVEVEVVDAPVGELLAADWLEEG